MNAWERFWHQVSVWVDHHMAHRHRKKHHHHPHKLKRISARLVLTC